MKSSLDSSFSATSQNTTESVSMYRISAVYVDSLIHKMIEESDEGVEGVHVVGGSYVTVDGMEVTISLPRILEKIGAVSSWETGSHSAVGQAAGKVIDVAIRGLNKYFTPDDDNMDTLDEDIESEKVQLDIYIYHTGKLEKGDIDQAILELGWRKKNEKATASNIPVRVYFPGRGQAYLRSNVVKLDDIQQNYDEATVAKARDVVEKMKRLKSGVVILHGPPGTGKTYLIRALLSEVSKEREAVICTPASSFLEEASGLVTAMSTSRRTVVVLEDIGDLLCIDAASRHMDARSNLLNISEGILSALSDSIIILSFNEDVNKIDPAIRRPGRCIAEISTKALTAEHASMLLGREVTKSMLLSEVFAERNSNEMVTTTKELGFSHEA